MNTFADELNPIEHLSNKNNYKKFSLIQKDGSIQNKVILSIPNIELREQIICDHYLRKHIFYFLNTSVEFRIKTRDNPWDFELELSNGENITIEITSIADQEDLFKKFKYEERLVQNSNKEEIELQEIIKLNYNFPDNIIQEKINEYKNQNVTKKNLITNPYFNKNFVFLSNFEEKIQSFDIMLQDSINKKVEKKHKGKEDLILIIDNRTITFTLKDLIHHFETMDDYFNQLPFKEVWFYTGYYSDDDGNNAEYNLIPLKLSNRKLEKLNNKLLK